MFHPIMRPIPAIALCVVLGSVSSSCRPASKTTQEVHELEIFEGFPEATKIRMDERDNYLKSLKPKPGGIQPYYLIQPTKRWEPAKSITVAFKGGSRQLRENIVAAAATWSLYGNVGFDFGYDPQNGTFREWTVSDQQPAAQVRIGFDAKGYWSCVGTDSVDPVCAGSNAASMNFQAFDRYQPTGWRATVLHEFGHALGFEHEHQNPNGQCDKQFRWDDDSGYARKTNASRLLRFRI
jgi:hypothetical protein